MTLNLLEHRWRELLIVLVLALLTTPVFWLTDLDLRAARWFYYPAAGESPWPIQQFWLWQIFYRYAYGFAYTVAIGALFVAALGYGLAIFKPWRKPALYILLVTALGPGLVVNLVFKDHWGRPRPVHMTDFGGEYQYVPPLKIGDTKDKSFTCGHCSVGFIAFALYFLARKRKVWYLALTMVLGLLLGLTRMSAGGHFVSDILWSGYLVFLVAWLLYYGWYARGEQASAS
ncbi:phosphatase PAP2 family protein [Methylosoma difficile]